MAWDGREIELKKAYERKRSENNFSAIVHKTGGCLRFDCANRNKLCDECLHFSMYKTK